MSAILLLVGFVLLSLVLAPLFFDIYRINMFDAVPRDDYAPFLLYFVGDAIGNYPGSPRGYRPLYPLLGLPFYYLIPLVTFTNLPDHMPLSYARATQALAVVSYLGITASMVLGYAVASRLVASRVAAAIAAAAIFVLIQYTGVNGTDPVTIAVLFGAIALLNRPMAFAGLVFATLFLNEKIALTLALALGMRFVFCPDLRRVHLPHLAAVGLALGVFLSTIAVVQLPGNEGQTDISKYWYSFVASLNFMMTTRGLYLNAWPMVLLTMVALIAWRGGGYNAAPSVLFRPSDIGVIYLMTLVGMVMNVELNVGRIAMHALPFLVIPFAHAVALQFVGAPPLDAGKVGRPVRQPLESADGRHPGT